MNTLRLTLIAAIFSSAQAFSAQSLSSQLALAAKLTQNNREYCETQLKALPKQEDTFPAEMIKGLKATPPFPKETSDMLEILAETRVPTDKADLKATVEILDAAPTCWDKNSLNLQFKAAKAILDQGTKRQKEDFTAALVNRMRSENKKTLLMLPLTVSLDALDQLANADLLNSSAREEIHQAHQHAQELASNLNVKFPKASEEKDNAKILEIRKAEILSCRQIQAQIDGILKKI